jgi:ferredoxin/coenzyme F420-reducing hydrogenase delta subunit
VPWFTARRGTEAPSPSFVDEALCVGCVQCSIDCPYSAITMVPRDSRRSDVVARVNPDLCVSCGICAGSCPPMGVGPPGRTGRDQLVEVRRFLATPGHREGEIVVICCERGAGAYASDLAAAGGIPYLVGCGGNLHTSVIELLLREGAGGVMVMPCPPRDCWHREGARWLDERVYHDREAELQPRVERARVRIVNAAARERGQSTAALRAFAAEVARLNRTDEGDIGMIEVRCEPAGAAEES